MSYDPVELVTVTESVLDKMDVIPDPDVNAFFLNKLAAEGIFLEVGAFEIGSETCIS
jgi:hypothetical protein